MGRPLQNAKCQSMGTRSQAEKMFSLITTIFTKLFGPKVGGTPVLLPRTQYYAVSGRAELAQNGGCQGSDGPQVYDAPYMHQPYNNSGPDMQTVQELGVSGRALYGV